MRILLAIPSPNERQEARRALVSGGFEDLVETANSAETINVLDQPRDGAGAEAVVLDMAQPDADGIETCATIRLQPKHRDTPIVVLAAPGDVQTLSQSFVAGASDYLFKPFHDIELVARMRSIARHKLQSDRRRGFERELQRFRRPGTIWRSHDGPAVDAETGLLGRQTLTETLMWHGQQDDHLRIAVLVAQVDALTSYRHLYGAEATASMLRQVTQALAGEPARLDDRLVAFDTGSFALVTRAPDEMFPRADRMRRRIADLRIPHFETALRDFVSVSIGVSVGHRSGRDKVSQLLPDAIRAAEQAAAEGGNRVVCVDES